jgi:hypothetical protein
MSRGSRRELASGAEGTVPASAGWAFAVSFRRAS